MAKNPHFIHNTDIGQNFLIDRSVVDYMIERSAPGKDDYVLEIGPGEGILTEGLLSTGLAGLCTLELDTRLKRVIEALAHKDMRLTALWGDAVQYDYERLLPWYPNRIIANLPYHITTPLLWTFLRKLVPHGLKYMLLMVQLESAERIISPPRHRERSPLGITIELMGKAEILRKIPPSAFRPQPRVNSCLVEIALGRNFDFAVNERWKGLLASSFTQRRKTLVNNWIAAYPAVNREIATEILLRHDLKPTSRAEELTVEEWLALLPEPAFGAPDSEAGRD